MKNIRTWDIWEGDVLGPRDSDYSMPLFLVLCLSYLAGLVLGLPVGIGMEEALGIMSPWSVLTTLVGLPAIMMSIVPNLHKLSIYRGIPDDSYKYDLKERVKEYMSLSKADKAEYPKDILNILKDPDLDHSQKAQLNTWMSHIYAKINTRNALRNDLVKREVDLTPVLQKLESAHNHLDIDIKTYSEFK